MERPPRCSHLLILQDDVQVSPNFVSAVKKIAAAQPDHPVCLFLGRLPRDAAKRAERAQKMNRRYIDLPLRSFMPIVAVLWPRRKLIEFRDWAEANPHLWGRVQTRSDDAMAGRWKLVSREKVLVAVPSIVQHPDVEPTTVGRTTQWGHRVPRTAVLFASDASVWDWSQP